jgi:hypothetical protein
MLRTVLLDAHRPLSLPNHSSVLDKVVQFHEGVHYTKYFVYYTLYSYYT